VNGDLLVAGGTIHIAGKVSQNVRAAGGNVNISGIVGKNVSVFGGNISVDPSAKLNGNLTSAAGNITLSAPVAGDVTLGSGNTTVSTTIGGNMETAAGKLLLTPGARISGNLTYWSNNLADIQTGATVSGSISRMDVPRTAEISGNREEIAKNVTAGITGLIMAVRIIGLISSLIIGLLVFNIFPVYAGNVAVRFVSQPWKSMGIGFLVAVTVPVAAIMLVFTVVGMPVAFFIFVMYLILMYLAQLVTALSVGQLILNQFNRKAAISWVFILGISVYFLVSLVPFLGKFILFFANLISVGAIITEKVAIYNQLKAKRLV
jgi:hypothetical protein